MVELRFVLVLCIVLPAACSRDALLGAELVDAAVDGSLAAADLTGCPTGKLWCNGSCIEPATDDANCGGGGRNCGFGIHCVAGICAQNACPSLLGLPGPPLTQAVGRQIALADPTAMVI